MSPVDVEIDRSPVEKIPIRSTYFFYVSNVLSQVEIDVYNSFICLSYSCHGMYDLIKKIG